MWMNLKRFCNSCSSLTLVLYASLDQCEPPSACVGSVLSFMGRKMWEV
ncbi:unnamed protein product [Periconia digitata]|uniref:Uncharacterized protein n=1 Tax=Periconia digitata TaxID=1303443 RepID=A0A9W4XRL2_9PLEO|nr:unnamed protein product [Periconia digitata]